MVVLLDNTRIRTRSQGPRIHKGFGPFFITREQLMRNNRSTTKEREEVRTMSVLFSELLVPGWADEKIGLDAVTGTYSDGSSFNLPCHTADPEIFFSEEELAITEAKSLCGGCPVRAQCLEGALSRKEPAGVWGGELFEDGRVISRKRKAGRPSAIEVAAREISAPIQKMPSLPEVASPASSESVRRESAA